LGGVWGGGPPGPPGPGSRFCGPCRPFFRARSPRKFFRAPPPQGGPGAEVPPRPPPPPGKKKRGIFPPFWSVAPGPAAGWSGRDFPAHRPPAENFRPQKTRWLGNETIPCRWEFFITCPTGKKKWGGGAARGAAPPPPPPPPPPPGENYAPPSPPPVQSCGEKFLAGALFRKQHGPPRPPPHPGPCPPPPRPPVHPPENLGLFGPLAPLLNLPPKPPAPPRGVP